MLSAIAEFNDVNFYRRAVQVYVAGCACQVSRRGATRRLCGWQLYSFAEGLADILGPRGSRVRCYKEVEHC